MKRVAQVLADRDEQPPLMPYLPALICVLIVIPAIAFFLTLLGQHFEERRAYFKPLYRDGMVLGSALAVWAVIRLRWRVGGWTGTGLCLSLYAYLVRVMHDITLGMPLPRDSVVAEEFALWRTGAGFVHPASVTMIWIGFALCAHACVTSVREHATAPRQTKSAETDPTVFD